MSTRVNTSSFVLCIALACLVVAFSISLRRVDAATGTADATMPPIPSTLQLHTFNPFPQLRFDTPTDIANAGDQRLFIVERPGTIALVTGRGNDAVKETFLDIKDRVTAGGEMGLLGVVFHPQYRENGYFYVNYTTGEPGTTLQSRISRFSVSTDANRADPQSELVLLTVDQPFTNHNAGDLAFGPDGYLYFGLGDGGSYGDPNGNAQNPEVLLGKLLRIDVDNTDPSLNYAIPPDNPFVGKPGRDELWALGLRNPWRFSFDRSTGALFIGDVGQDSWEEVNFQPSGSPGGQNYGWKFKEGTHCFEPAEECDPGGLTDPIFEYPHGVGCSVTGGFVYRGKQYPLLQGLYIFADYCQGLTWALYRDESDQWQELVLGTLGKHLTTFGEDTDGELYLARSSASSVFKLTVRYQVRVPLVSAP